MDGGEEWVGWGRDMGKVMGMGVGVGMGVVGVGMGTGTGTDGAAQK